MMDPYIYPGTQILKNKLNIHDEQELINIEAQLLIAGIIDIPSIIDEIDFKQYQSLQTIHFFLFQDLYEWAGEFRSINIYKSELVLGGVSVMYSDYQTINAELEAIFKWINNVVWNHTNLNLAQDFSKLMTDIWRVHPFREGNTRAVSIFMKLFADKHDIPFNAQLLSENAGYLRNALVLAAVAEAPEPQHLLRILSDALALLETPTETQDRDESSSYTVIGKYNVSNYEEKPFKTDYEGK